MYVRIINQFLLLAILLMTSATGCQRAGTDPNLGEMDAELGDLDVQFGSVDVRISNVEGMPLSGVKIVPSIIRGSSGAGALSAYSWAVEIYGPPEESITNEMGTASVRYPTRCIPFLDQPTGSLGLQISHPDYGSEFIQSYSVNGLERPVLLKRGLVLRISGYFGDAKQPVSEVLVQLDGNVSQDDWVQSDSGLLVLKNMSPGHHLIRLMGRLPSGEIGYSDPFPFLAKNGKEHRFELEIKPGVRVEGILSNDVPRPVSNGRAVISVWPQHIPSMGRRLSWSELFDKFPLVRSWHSYRPIEADGTFVFESVPPGEMNLTVHGDGFVSQDGDRSLINAGFALPQRFELMAPIERVEVVGIRVRSR